MKEKFRQLSMKRLDFILIGILLVSSLLPILIFKKNSDEKNATNKYLSVQVGGVEIKKVNLKKGQRELIPIEKDGKVKNLVEVKDGVVDMIEADCPDQLCVKATPITEVGSTIVCLPNKVVLEIKGNTDQKDINKGADTDINTY